MTARRVWTWPAKKRLLDPMIRQCHAYELNGLHLHSFLGREADAVLRFERDHQIDVGKGIPFFDGVGTALFRESVHGDAEHAGKKDVEVIPGHGCLETSR